MYVTYETCLFVDIMYWTELRYDEGGRYVVCSRNAGMDGFKSLTRQEFNARTRVHEYGGGASCIHNGTVYFSNFGDQNLYKQSCAEDEPTMVTKDGMDFRYADGQYNIKVILPEFL